MNTTHKEPTVGCFSAIMLIILAACLLLAFGCTSTKHIETTSATKEEKKELNVDSVVKSSEEKIRKQYDEKQKETNATIDFMKDNEGVMENVINELQDNLYAKGMSADSVNEILSRLRATPCNQGGKVKVNTDGSYELSGIKSLNAKIFELQKKIDSTAQKKYAETELHKTDTEEKKEAVTTVKIDKKTKILSWIMFLAAGYVLGIFFPPMKIVHVVKTLITKKQIT